MGRTLVLALLPWLGVLLGAAGAAWWLARNCRATVQWRRLALLHADQGGSVQSLSFIYTLPIFIWVLMLIVQVSQLMIGVVMVNYAAFAAARTAIVTIPARMGLAAETENCLASFSPDPEAANVFPETNPTSPQYRPSSGGVTYLVADPGMGSWFTTAASSPKCRRIALAAALACVPISPSRDLGLPSASGSATDSALRTAYTAIATRSTASSTAVSQRLTNKLSYATARTEVQVRFYHSNSEPPLQINYDQLPPYPPQPNTPPPAPPYSDQEFKENEIGWQDPVTVTVRHYFALLPGPGRLLAPAARAAGAPVAEDSVAVEKGGKRSYYYQLQASATLGNEGQKPVVPYEYSY